MQKPDWLVRLQEERDALQDKLTKLEVTLTDTDKLNKIDFQQRYLLNTQYAIMAQYCGILTERIRLSELSLEKA